MKIISIESLFRSGNLFSFGVFDTDSNSFDHKISKIDFLDQFYNSNCSFSFICFDSFKLFPFIKNDFLWDVKILHELLGHKFDNFISLSKEILGNEDVKNYVDVSNTINAHIKSFKESKIDLSQYNILQYLPLDIIEKMYLERSKIIFRLFFRIQEQDKSFYLNFYNSLKSLFEISSVPLNIDLSCIEDDSSHFAHQIRKSTKNNNLFLHFNPVGSKTGRLGFKKDTVNIYTLPRETRKCIVASNGCKLVELDFKSFQPRIAIFSTKNEQFKDVFREVDDIYSVLPGDRNKNKISFLMWMFSKNKMSNEIFDKYFWEIWNLREELAITGKSKGFLETIYGRKVICKDQPGHVIFQNFITATEVDCILNVMQKLLENKNIKVLTPFHDAVICEVKEDFDSSILKQESEKFMFDVFKAKFPVSIKEGKNFGTMNEV